MTQPAEGFRDREPAVWGAIPQRNRNFTGRDGLLVDLHDRISNRTTAVLLPHTLRGFGGVGKSQTAIEYAYRYRAEYDLIWWVPADQDVLVRSSLANLAPKLGLPAVSSTGTGIEDTAAAVLDALRRGEPFRRWLLIFDNANEPEDFAELIPHGPGHVLITSRNVRWEQTAHTVTVDVFPREESIDFLMRRVPSITEEQAAQLAEDLGDLPLALEQAGALQSETGMTVDDYRELLKDRVSQLMNEGKPNDYPASMTAAWGLSVSSLTDRMPEAVDLLRCCAFFGPEPIPRAVFRQQHLPVGPQLAEITSNPIRLSRAIGELNRYALARIDNDSQTIQIHRLVQALLRDELPPDEHDRLRAEVHILLAAYAPESTAEARDRAKFQNILGHIRPSRIAEARTPEVRALIFKIIAYLAEVGDTVSARTMVEQVLDQWRSDLGEDHEDVLLMRIEYSDILRELGRYEQAREHNLRTYEMADACFGTDHVISVRALRGKAADMRAAGDFAKAREFDEDAMRRCERMYGSLDGRSLRTLNSLALDVGLSGDYRGAKEMHERAYIGHMQAGSSRITRVAAWSGLARAVRLCGEYAEASDLGDEVYSYVKAELGLEHNWTLRTAKDLAIAWRRAGDVERALELAYEVHDRYVKRFDVNHPDTLAAAMCLANAQRAAGHLNDARMLAEDSVRKYPFIYGPDHPYNHGCAGNLAILLRVLNDPSAARKTNEVALRGLRDKLGPDHHYPLTVAANMASDLAALGEYEEAAEIGTDTLERLRVLMGADHPMALLAAANLTFDLRELGRADEAEILAAEVTAGYMRTLTLDHPDARAFQEGRRLDGDFDPPPI
ncbi:FxSxx-COOH system tetratricopeptide repeat protein [Actinocorallia longicatena]|uniref:DUF7779 domain-containing protein n=1 Tax=Actinocorallia longicatena TaxID=111803 RepID=A0ABP6PZZ2_9ACTN